jgi:hypothetical protein
MSEERIEPFRVFIRIRPMLDDKSEAIGYLQKLDDETVEYYLIALDHIVPL